jgi:hypothetical protein
MFFYKIIFTLLSTIIINNYISVISFDIVNFSKFKLLDQNKYCINSKLQNFSQYKNKRKSKYKYKILKTSILNFLPFLKLHHIVVISNKEITDKIYTVDFSPINQSYHKTLLKLFFSKKVLAEIRIRVFENISLDDGKYIIEKWANLTNLTYNESQELSEKVFNEIIDDDLKNIIKKIKLYDTYMNLYKNNCQHFSKYVTENIDMNISHE